jgi:hypothetical protein
MYRWIDQPLFFHLHVTFYIIYATGVELSAVMSEVAQVLRWVSLTASSICTLLWSVGSSTRTSSKWLCFNSESESESYVNDRRSAGRLSSAPGYICQYDRIADTASMDSILRYPWEFIFQEFQQIVVAETCLHFSWSLWEQSFSSHCNGNVQ